MSATGHGNSNQADKGVPPATFVGRGWGKGGGGLG